MKKVIAIAMAAGLMTAPATANEFKAFCEEYTANAEIDSGPCGCLDEKVGKDADIVAEIMAMEPDTALESLSEPAQAAIGRCWEAPEEGATE